MTVDFSKGLVPTIVRDARSGAILTVAFMNDEALRRTIDSGETWLWSRSRNELWHKGATSGNRQRVVHIATDCDNDAIVLSVIPEGPACHTGAASCFADIPPASFDLTRLMNVLRDRKSTLPEGSYSAYLFREGRDKILKKVGEEATEVVIAAKSETNERLASEVADLVFHLSVLLTEADVSWDDVGAELRKREK